MTKKTEREFFYLGARVMCCNVLGIEPTAEQLEQAADITDEMERQHKGLFMYGYELKMQTMRIVAEANGIPAKYYEVPPETRAERVPASHREGGRLVCHS